MDYKNLTQTQCQQHCALNGVGYALMQHLLDRIHAEAALAMENGKVYQSLPAFRSLAFAVDALLTGIVQHDGQLAAVYDFLLEHNVYTDILKQLGMQNFTNALAMAMVDTAMPVRDEYLSWDKQDNADLEAQWAIEPWMNKTTPDNLKDPGVP